jgi:hypothetical protein
MATSPADLLALLKRRLPPTPPRFAVRASMALHQALLRAAEAVMPAEIVALDHASGVVRTGLIGAAAQLGFADHLADGPLTAAEIAARCGAPADGVHRTLRALVSLGVFALDADGRFQNNRISDTLRVGADGSMRDTAVYFASASNVGAWGDYLRTVQTGKNAFERVHGKSVWAWLEEHPDEARTFNGFMQTTTERMTPAVATGFPFEGIQRLCDVAGGRGTLLAGILAAHPGMRGVLADSPHVLEEAKLFLAARGLSDRVEFAPANFFERVPEGADAYMLKDILHDWDDERSLQILGNVRRAMQPGHRLLVVELVVGPTDTDSMGPLIDVHMMTVTGDGRQRSEDEFRSLFERTGFRFARSVALATPGNVIEGFAV